MISIQTMIAKIIRDCRLKDATFAEDMLEWIPSAMGELQTNLTLSPTSELVQVIFHKAPMPNGLQAILSVTHGGHRMAYANPDQDINYAKIQQGNVMPGSVFLSQNKDTENVMDLESASILNSSYMESTLQPVDNAGQGGQYWYRDLPDCIETSLSNGMIRVNFMQIPMDEEGFPLIPDNENYKEAIYYKIRQKLIEAGYPDSVLKWEVCMQLFEKYAGRALGEIRYPSTDRIEAMNRTLTRLLPPSNYYENFSDNRSQEAYPISRSTWRH